MPPYALYSPQVTQDFGSVAIVCYKRRSHICNLSGTIHACEMHDMGASFLLALGLGRQAFLSAVTGRPVCLLLMPLVNDSVHAIAGATGAGCSARHL